MPELPEVEYAAGRLRAAAIGATVSSVEVSHPALARTLTLAARKSLIGKTLTAVQRRGKMQLITFDDGHVLEVHFRMTGDWDIGQASDAAPRFERARLQFSNGVRVSLVDSRALGVMRVHAPGALTLSAMGVEPLDDTFTAETFASALAKQSRAIKLVLLNQRVLAGVGNIYACEALWVARIHPTRAASALSFARVKRLRDAVRKVLTAATNSRYYGSAAVAADDVTWRVYDREGQTCTRCRSRIRRITQGARSTYYCGGCQR